MRRLSRLFSRWLLRFAVVVLVVGLAAPHLWAWHHLREARAALGRYHPDDARKSLAICLRTWPDRPDLLFLASRAARQSGDIVNADAMLRACQRANGGTSDEIAFEWALLQATAGNVEEVEEYLVRQTDRDPRAGPLAWEAITQGYLRVYRSPDAMRVLDHWLTVDPDNVRALELRGQTYVAGKGGVRGAEDFRRVLERDPSRDDTRRRLIRVLLNLGGYSEALPHLEWLGRKYPGDPEVASGLARCLFMNERRSEAWQVLDAALAQHPDDPGLLLVWGNLARIEQRLPEAERVLRRVVELRPEDYEAQQDLGRVITQQPGREEEGKARLQLAEKVKDRSERLGELRSRRLPARPLDPGLHVEMGVLLMQSGQEEQGAVWLARALSLDPNYRPAHAALAMYYAARGDTAQAEAHRRAAGPR